MNLFTLTGDAIRTRIDSAGFVLDLLVRTFASLRMLPRRSRFLFDMAFNAGVRALPVTMVVAAFAGAILAMQTGIELKRFGDTGVLGTITALSMCREMGPFITAVILAATVGSSMAAEVGTMKVSDEISALATHQKIPPSMYLNATAFFMVYHASAVVVMRAVRSFTLGLGELARKLAWIGIVALTAIFWAWGETAFYFQLAPNDGANVWYEDLPKMIAHGSWFYALYFIVSFPIVYRLDEHREAERWPLSRVVLEACAVGMITLFFIDLATWYVGGKL